MNELSYRVTEGPFAFIFGSNNFWGKKGLENVSIFGHCILCPGSNLFFGKKGLEDVSILGSLHFVGLLKRTQVSNTLFM